MKLVSLTAGVVLVLSSVPLRSAEAPPTADLEAVRQSIQGPVDWAQWRRGGAVRRGFVARGPRGGVIAGRRAAVVRPGYRPYPYRPVRPVPVPIRPVVGPGWVRPPGYWWRPGAAVGFVSAAAATAYVNTRPPVPGYCWYYTNPQRTRGFWDACPR